MVRPAASALPLQYSPDLRQKRRWGSAVASLGLGVSVTRVSGHSAALGAPGRAPLLSRTLRTLSRRGVGVARNGRRGLLDRVGERGDGHPDCRGVGLPCVSELREEAVQVTST